MEGSCYARSCLVRNWTGTAEIAHDMIGRHVSARLSDQANIADEYRHYQQTWPSDHSGKVCNWVSATMAPKQGSERRVSRSTSKSLLRVGSAVCGLAVWWHI